MSTSDPGDYPGAGVDDGANLRLNPPSTQAVEPRNLGEGGQVKKRMLALTGVLALVAAVALTIVATGSAKRTAGIKVALITDIGGLNDKGFNSLAYKGLQDAQKKLGIDGRVFISKSAADYVPNLSTAANGGYDLVVAVGFLMADATAAVAKKFPDTKFAIVDYPASGLKGKPTNARGILFAEQEAGCLAGVAAAKTSKTGSISSVGGIKIPPVDAYIAGYEFCAKKVNPAIKVAHDYSQDFVAQDKCKEIALKQIDAGSDVVFQVAGQCGLGAIDGAKERKVWGIGVDTDQGFLGTHVLTSATKKVDSGVFQTIQLANTGKFVGGVDGLFNVANGGTGYGKVSTAAPGRASLINLLGKWSKQLASGAVKPPRVVK
jgi:basic membrane protein A